MDLLAAKQQLHSEAATLRRCAVANSQLRYVVGGLAMAKVETHPMAPVWVSSSSGLTRGLLHVSPSESYCADQANAAYRSNYLLLVVEEYGRLLLEYPVWWLLEEDILLVAIVVQILLIRWQVSQAARPASLNSEQSQVPPTHVVVEGCMFAV